MIYLPEHFKTKENELILNLVNENSFATLISIDSTSQPLVSHIPILAEVKNDQITKLVGHFALRNPHVAALKQNPNSTVIFQGPHTYITPLWYRSGRDVPTWNYSVVHISGKLKLISGFKEICEILEKMTNFYEQGPDAWKFELPSDLEDPSALTSAIVGFEIIPEKIEAKFKLSQNRSAEDQSGILEGLQKRTDEKSRTLHKMMKRILKF